MASNFNGKKTATLAVVALVALASAGSAFYFLNSNQVSADLIDPDMPAIPGEPISQPTSIASQTTQQSMNIPPIPTLPNNASDSSSSTTTSSDFENSSSNSQVSSLGVDEIGASSSEGSTQDNQSSLDTTGLSAATQLSPTDNSFDSEGLPSANDFNATATSNTVSNTIYGTIAAIVAAVALIALVLLAMKWKGPSDQTPPLA